MWKTVKLGDVCTVTNGSTPLRKEKRYWEEGNIPWFTIDDFRVQGKNIRYTKQNVTQAAVDDKKVRLVPANSVLLCCTASIGVTAIARVPMATNQQFNALTPKSSSLNSDYLYFVATTLTKNLLSVSGSTTINFVSMSKLKNISIPLPPLEEQKRIVAKLDAAFAEIDEAIKVAEQNAKNADDILERSIPKIITKNSSEIVTCTLGSAFSLSSGKLLSKKDMVNDGKINVYGGNGITGKHNAYNLQGKNILIGRVGAKCGNVHYVDESLWLTDNAMYAHTFNYEFNLEFISLLLSKLNLGKYARQAAQPVISFSSIKDIIISFPKDLREQKQIIKSVLDIENHTRSLTKLHEYRQDNYNVLKSAILKQELQSSEAA